MDKFLTGIKRKNNDTEEAGTSKDHKTRKYDPLYLAWGFTFKDMHDQQRPMCLLCTKILAADSMKPNKLKRHFETVHSEYVGKSKDFFQRKLNQLSKQQKTFQKTASVTSKALLASYKVSHRIAKCKKAHSIGETLILPAAIDMVAVMFGETYADQLRMIPLADNTVGRRIGDISEDICDQLIKKTKLSLFALQVDEATDVVKDAHLIAYVRYVEETEIREDMLFCKPIDGKATATEVFKIIDTFFEDNGILWKNCIGLCTDGAPSMAGKNAGLQALVRNVAPRAMWTHCMLHRQSLVSKNMSVDLQNIFDVITRVVNFIKNSPLKGRLFAKLCDDMGAEHRALLYYCEARWLSRSNVLQRVFELKDEIAMFLNDNNKKDEANLFYDLEFRTKFAYLVDIFDKLATLNKGMQGPHVHALIQTDKITAFIKKLELWAVNVENNNLEMFVNLKITCPANKIESIKNLILTHLKLLQTQFKFYFKDLDMSKYEWIRNPFIINNFNSLDLSCTEQEMLIDLSSDRRFEKDFLRRE